MELSKRASEVGGTRGEREREKAMSSCWANGDN